VLRSLFVIVLMTLGISAALFNRFPALLLYVWFALFRPQEWLWVDITSLRLSLVLGLLLVVPSLATGILPNLTHPLSFGAVAFLLTGLVAQTQATRPDIGWVWIDYLSRLILICLLSTTLTNTRRRLFAMIAVASVSIGFQSAKAGLASLLGGGVRFSDGQAGSFIDNNGYALAIAMIIPLLIATARNWPREWRFNRWFRFGLWIWVPLSAFAIISTFSRGGLLALIAMSLVLIALQRARLRVFAALVLIGLAVGPFIPIPKGYFDRVETIQTYQEIDEDSAVSRLHFWRVALDMVHDNPLGVGLKNYEQRYNDYDFLNGRYGTHRAVHSSHFQVLAEQGYAGAAIWVGLFGYAIFVCLRVRKRAGRFVDSPADSAFDVNCSDALLASMVAFIVGGAFIALSLNDLTWMTFAMVASLERINRQGARRPAPVTPVQIAGLRPAASLQGAATNP
jgi:probable O-glycosylation ligase (exosortase A-associated)